MTTISTDLRSGFAINPTAGGGYTSRVHCTLSFARREFLDALSSRWFLLYTIAFSVLSIAVSFMSLAGSGSQGFAGFGRTTAGLLNLIMLVVPLMALIAGAGSIAGERERGTLLYLLAQPITRTELLIGKYIGLAIAMCCSMGVGFGLSAAVLAWKAGGVGLGSFLMLILFTCMLSLAMLSVGMLLSVLSRRSGVATGLGLFCWLALVFLSDLGLMAGTVIFKLRVQEVFTLAIINPLQAFKMGVIVNMNASLDVLGPVGTYASRTFGDTLSWLLTLTIVAWIFLPLIIALLLFRKRGGI
jgi:Cu-processing system permease protein